MMQTKVLLLLFIVATHFYFIACRVAVAGAPQWGTKGHPIVADIATDLLSSGTAAKVKALLPSGGTLASVSTLADSYRSQSGGSWSAPMHYADVPRGQSDFVMSRDCPSYCVVSAIQNYTSRMQRGTTTPPPELSSLEFLVHFVGDIHQPLHVGYAEDLGGNEVQVVFFGRSTNLHSVWDSAIIDQYLNGSPWQTLSTELKNFIHSNSSIIAEYTKNMSPVDWARQSYATVRTVVYNYQSTNLGQAYQNLTLPVVKRCLMGAGIRLAALLTSILGN